MKVLCLMILALFAIFHEGHCDELPPSAQTCEDKIKDTEDKCKETGKNTCLKYSYTLLGTPVCGNECVLTKCEDLLQNIQAENQHNLGDKGFVAYMINDFKCCECSESKDKCAILKPTQICDEVYKNTTNPCKDEKCFKHVIEVKNFTTSMCGWSCYPANNTCDILKKLAEESQIEGGIEMTKWKCDECGNAVDKVSATFVFVALMLSFTTLLS